jgi:D-glycero-alpha-D-manno-heptose-7-phosphate kinase
MSFFGGGTDFSGFYNEHGGAVLSTTFDKYCYVTVRHLPRFFEYKTHLTYSKTEYVNDIAEIQHPAIRNAMQWLDMYDLRMTYESDLPARSGLGTSSSFAVGMLEAFYALKGQYASKRKLADDAIYLERTLCAEAGGIQDQIAASFGGFNRINFTVDGYTVNPVVISPERKKLLNNHLMLFFTGFSRFSSDIQKNTEKSMKDKTQQLIEMYELVDKAEQVLINKDSDLDDFGRLLDYTWRLKRGISSGISTGSIDEQYETAMKAGALGGKLLGAGGGGFLLFYVPIEKQDSVRSALKDLMYVPFKFENDGTKIIFYNPEDYTAKY